MKKCVILLAFIFLLTCVNAILEIGGDEQTGVIELGETLNNFLGLTDTPSSYSGEGTNCVLVNVGETALEFGVCGAGGGGDKWVDIGTFIIPNSTFADDIRVDLIEALDWTNFTGTEAQILDLSHTTDTNASACGDGEYLDGDETCISFNDSVKSLFAEEQVVYNATSIDIETGTLDGGNLTSVQILGDGDTYNISEISGTPGWLVNVTFTNVTNFNTVAIRGKYDGGAGHTIDLELFRLTTQTWDDFGDITDQPGFGVTSFPVFVGSDFINTTIGNGTVRFRFNHDDPGNPAHDYFLDAIFIGQVTGLISGGAHDDTTGRNNIMNHPWAMDTAASRDLTGTVHIINDTLAFDFWNTGNNSAQTVGIFRGNNRSDAASLDNASLDFYLDNNNSDSIKTNQIVWQANDVTAGSMDTELRFYALQGGTMHDFLTVGSTSSVGVIGFNQDKLDVNYNFRTDNNDFTLYIDGGTDTVVFGGTTPQGYVTIDGKADEIQLLVEGHLTQNDNIFEVESFGNFERLAVDSTGDTIVSQDLEYHREIKPDGDTCSNEEILKKTGAADWDCAADADTIFSNTNVAYINNTQTFTGINNFSSNTTLAATANVYDNGSCTFIARGNNRWGVCG